MMSWLLAPWNTVFAAAFVVLVCFALLEVISLLLGLGVSDFLSDLLGLPDGSPDAPAAGEAPAAGDGTPSQDTGTSSGAGGFFGALLAWLEIGRVPVLVSLCAWLGAFSVGGMALQSALIAGGPGPLIQPVAALLMAVAALPVMKLCNRVLGRLIPQDETSAFAPGQLLGRVGTVTIGTATTERAAEVRVTGPDGRPHYIMSYADGAAVPQGGELLLKTRDAATGHFRGEANRNPDLSPSVYQ